MGIFYSATRLVKTTRVANLATEVAKLDWRPVSRKRPDLPDLSAEGHSPSSTRRALEIPLNSLTIALIPLRYSNLLFHPLFEAKISRFRNSNSHLTQLGPNLPLR
jgi:hypothetical protein